MRKLCGPLLMAAGVLEVLHVLVFHSPQLAALGQDGFFDVVDPNVAYAAFDWETAFWHPAFGLMAITLCGLIHRAQAWTGTLLAFLGWSLLALSLAALVLIPVSGCWSVLSQAVLTIVVSCRGRLGGVATTDGGRRAAG